MRRWFYAGFLLIVFAAGLQGQDRAALLRKLEDLPGFETSGTPQQYDLSTIDGFDRTLAPALRLYGLGGITVQQWKTPEGTVKATLFQMVDAPAAYGVYTLKRSTLGGQATPVLIGAASFRYANQLYFWQSNYTVQIDGPMEPQNRLAQSLSRNILGRSQKPPVSEYLPAANLVPGTERYLLSADTLDPAVRVDPHTLGFDSSAEAASASYRVGTTMAHLLLVLYPTQHLARKYEDQLASSSQISGGFKKRAGPLLAIVYGISDEKLAASILDDVSHEFKVTWNEPRPGLGLGTMLITIFTFIGVALVFTTIAGVSFGGLRVFLKSRYPNRIFDRPEAMELIQLKLNQGITNKQIEGNMGADGS
jgi:hypothetical protein